MQMTQTPEDDYPNESHCKITVEHGNATLSIQNIYLT